MNSNHNSVSPAGQGRGEIALIALDLDGTLTNEQKEITPQTQAALMQVQQQGVRLCLASGRAPFGMYPLARQLHLEDYGGLLLSYNGGYIQDCHTGEVFVEQTLDLSLLPELKAFQRDGLTLMTYYNDTIYTEVPDSPYVQISSRNNKMSIVGVEDFVRDIPRPIHKCLMVGPPESVSRWEPVMQKAMHGRMHICHSSSVFIELLPLGIDKGTALRALAERLGLPIDSVMAFGDSHNDISMLQTAGIGVAMGNAEPEVIEAADYVTLTNEEDGIAAALHQFLPAMFGNLVKS